MIVIRTIHDLEAAQAAYADTPVLCQETGECFLPGLDRPLRRSPAQIGEILAAADTKRFPDEAGTVQDVDGRETSG